MEPQPLKHARRPKLKGRKVGALRKCTRVDRLFGPTELDILDNAQTDTRVVLLGDMHTSRKKCPTDTRCGKSIWSYLEQLFQEYKGRQPIDFFLELPFIEPDQAEVKGIDVKRATQLKSQIIQQQAPYKNYLASLHVYFYNCWQRAKTTCDFFRKPIRFHYSDVREGVIHSGTSFEERSHINVIRDLFNLKNGDIKQHHMNKLRMFYEKYLEGNVDFFFRLSKIDKQLAKIPQQKRDELHKMMADYMKQTTAFATHAQAILDEMIAAKSPLVVENEFNTKLFQITGSVFFAEPDRIQFSELVHFMIGALLSPLFDIYTLARMIRLDMKHVIIYAGATHTQRIKWFLQRFLNFKSTVSVASKKQGTNFQCISMKKVPQPWFI